MAPMRALLLAFFLGSALSAALGWVVLLRVAPSPPEESRESSAPGLIAVPPGRWTVTVEPALTPPPNKPPKEETKLQFD